MAVRTADEAYEREREAQDSRATTPGAPHASPITVAWPLTAVSVNVRVVAAVLLVALTVVAYLPALHAGFVWDDDLNLTANPLVRDLAGLRQMWLEPVAWYQYYPLTFSTFFVEYHLWGTHPFGYHLDNVLLHALNAVLVWLLLRELRLPGAWLAAAIFALHPIQVESVAWIAERKNVLSGAFFLTALLAYLRGTLQPQERSSARREWYSCAAACLLFVAALLSKTATCSLPAVAFLLTWWRRGVADRRALWTLAPLVVAGIVMASTTVWIERHHAGAEGEEWASRASA